MARSQASLSPRRTALLATTVALAAISLTACSQSSVLAHESFAPDSTSPSASATSPAATSTPTGPTATATALAPTRTLLAGPAVATLAGTHVVFKAVVVPVHGSVTPTGNVSFVDGKKVLATTVLVPGHGSATAFLSTALPAGANAIVARYNGDDTAAPSTSGSLTVTAATASTAVSLVVKPKANHPGRFRLAVSVQGPKPGPQAVGVVSIIVAGRGYVARLDAQGHTFIDVALPLGRSYAVSVRYGGDSALTPGGTVRTFFA
ncbi:MAG TPA: Ig-like domain-containing protein [Actinomycetes bacterium]